MATLTISTSADGHDWARNDLTLANPWLIGATGNSPQTAYGQGLRSINVTLTGADTITEAYWDLLKKDNQFSNMYIRLTFTNEDNRSADWSDSSPNRPGDPAIQSSFIADQQLANNETDGVRYQFPTTSLLKGTFGSGADATISRAGWASGNALGSVCNSAQDGSAYSSGFDRKTWHDNDSSTASSEPALVLTYTPGSSAASLDWLAVSDVLQGSSPIRFVPTLGR